MKTRHTRKMILAAAVAALMGAPAFGQFLAGQSGHAVDANNQVGSGGVNSTYNRGGVTPNQIIYGNVTNVLPFEGFLPERDASAFTGPISSLADNFIRLSSGAPTAYQAPNILNTPQPFYGSSRAVAPPIGTERYGYTGAYVGGLNGTESTSEFPVNTDVTAGLDIQKQQLGQPEVLGSRTTLLGDQSGQLNLNGPLEAQDQANIYAGSPLYGVRSLSGLTGLPGDEQNSPLYGASALTPGGADRFRFQPDVQKMRQELNSQNGNNANQQNNGSQPNNTNNSQPPGLNQPLEGPNNERLNAATNGSVNNSALQNNVNDQEGFNQSLNLVPARQQSSQYNQLEQRLQRYESPQLRQMKASAAYTDLLAKQRAKAMGGVGGAGPTSRPANGRGAGLPPGGLDQLPGAGLGAQPIPRSGDFAPLHIKSLADGVSAKGLHDLLASAETSMRKDKFEDAIKDYNKANQVVPNNGLIPLGRANAELGAGYYRKASADLHQVFQSDPALLMGQYDLSNWLSAKRLTFITKELTALAASDKTQETPVFLLAYINYNTGHAAQAAANLKDARQRANGGDLLLDELEARWLLPQPDMKTPMPNLNK